MRRPIALAALALAFSSVPAAAQPRVAAPGSRPAERHADSNALRAQLGIPVAQRLLASDDFAARIRGIERLGAIGSTEAFDALVDAMDPQSVAARDVRARLAAVRVLAGEANRDNVRQLLLREVTDAGVAPLSAVLRATAALALSRSGEKKALSGLLTVVLQGGPAGEAAVRALRAAPPASLEALLEGRKKLTPALATFLGELGDMRAIERLRGMLADTDQAGKVAAALSLAKLGDESALAVAREWLKKSEPRQRRAAAEVLVFLDAPEAPAAVAALLESDATREDGLRLALSAPSPALAPALARILPDLPDEPRLRAVAALGRAGAVAQLVPLLDKPETALAAAFALATAPGAEARAAIEQGLAGDKARSGDGRRLLLRAGVVRALVLDDAPSGLKGGLRALFKETTPADRAAGAFGLVALGITSLEDVLEASCKKGDELVCDAAAAAGARGALALPDGPSSLSPLLPLLARVVAEADPRLGAGSAPTERPRVAHDDVLAVALGAALLAHPDGAGLPTSVLAAWAEAGGPLSPLCARALPARDDEALRGRIKRLLEGSDPTVRAHVALGLARDPEPSAVSLLTTAYRFEDEATVRRAVVRALSRRTEVQRAATLALARDLDPDDEVRALAAAALAGRVLDPALRPARGVEPRRQVAWVSILPNDGRAGHLADPLRTARLVRSDGLAVPVVADPDGTLLVPGMLAGAASLALGRGRAGHDGGPSKGPPSPPGHDGGPSKGPPSPPGHDGGPSEVPPTAPGAAPLAPADRPGDAPPR
jgi:HEAT repeat protein